VATAIGIGNLFLIGAAALAATGQVWVGIAAAIAVVAILLTILQRWSRGTAP
jgi:hypothetical protein